MPRQKTDDTELISTTLALLHRAQRFNERSRQWAIEEIADEFASNRNCQSKTLRDRLHKALPTSADELRCMAERSRTKLAPRHPFAEMAAAVEAIEAIKANLLRTGQFAEMAATVEVIKANLLRTGQFAEMAATVEAIKANLPRIAMMVRIDPQLSQTFETAHLLRSFGFAAQQRRNDRPSPP